MMHPKPHRKPQDSGYILLRVTTAEVVHPAANEVHAVGVREHLGETRHAPRAESRPSHCSNSMLRGLRRPLLEVVGVEGISSSPCEEGWMEGWTKEHQCMGLYKTNLHALLLLLPVVGAGRWAGVRGLLEVMVVEEEREGAFR